MVIVEDNFPPLVNKSPSQLVRNWKFTLNPDSSPWGGAPQTNPIYVNGPALVSVVRVNMPSPLYVGGLRIGFQPWGAPSPDDNELWTPAFGSSVFLPSEGLWDIRAQWSPAPFDTASGGAAPSPVPLTARVIENVSDEQVSEFRNGPPSRTLSIRQVVPGGTTQPLASAFEWTRFRTLKIQRIDANVGTQCRLQFGIFGGGSGFRLGNPVSSPDFSELFDFQYGLLGTTSLAIENPSGPSVVVFASLGLK